MIRLCDGADDYSQDESGMPCRCGRSYDDVDRSTRWPHDVLPPAGPVIRADSAPVGPPGATTVRLNTPQAAALLARVVTQLREAGRA
jgi:hypothetical protein